MKRKGRKTVSGIAEMKKGIQKQVEDMTARARVQVERKSNWVAGKVEHAMEKIDHAMDEVDRSIAEDLSK